MRGVVPVAGVLLSLLCAGTVFAQAALVATGLDPDKLPPEAQLTLRPVPGLEDLANKAARVLSLRTGARVEVGDNPPPELLEAVPAGHVAIARERGQVRLVLGAALGRSFEAYVQIADGHSETDVRSVALAVEALRDRAIEARDALEHDLAQQKAANAPLVPGPGATGPPGEVQPTAAGQRVNNGVAMPHVTVEQPAGKNPLADSVDEPRTLDDKLLKPVQPFFFLSIYGGASSESSGARMGIGSGGGLCVLGHCLLLSIEYPMPLVPEANVADVRYRYPTFTAGFYTHPISFGRFKPGASVGFLTRVGHFERDMGLPSDSGLDTDLGARATLEGAFELTSVVDAVAEIGTDFALDRWRIGHGDAVAYRGDRVIPWAQMAVRLRPY